LVLARDRTQLPGSVCDLEIFAPTALIEFCHDSVFSLTAHCL
jgi:hypothetical protein